MDQNLTTLKTVKKIKLIHIEIYIRSRKTQRHRTIVTPGADGSKGNEEYEEENETYHIRATSVHRTTHSHVKT